MQLATWSWCEGCGANSTSKSAQSCVRGRVLGRDDASPAPISEVPVESVRHREHRCGQGRSSTGWTAKGEIAHDGGPDLARRCVSLAHALELPLAGIDLRITPTGRVVCFEVNPSPAFSYYESHTGQPIAAAIARS